jgi:hypothetical protein
MGAITQDYNELVNSGFSRQDIYRELVLIHGKKKTDKFVAGIIRRDRELLRQF